jgi:HEAT repeat protein
MPLDRTTPSPDSGSPAGSLVEACLATGGAGSDAYWRAADALRALPAAEVLDTALRLAREDAPLARTLGLDLLNQIGGPARPYRDQVRPVLLGALDDPVPSVRRAAVAALGFEEGEDTIAALVARCDDPDGDVRYALAVALGHRADDRIAVDALIALAHDREPVVREWATFGLGSLCTLTTPAIVAALLERAGDTDRQTREEALKGIERRKADDGVIRALADALGSRSAGRGLLEAAGRLADPRLLPALLRVNAWSDAETLLLEHAIHACSEDDERSDDPR